MSSFGERQKNLFDHLKDAEDQYSYSKTNKASSSNDNGVIDRNTYRRLKREMKQFRGKESIFKRPESSLRECLRAKNIPDYMRNPQKWVHYSMSDVTPEQMSDHTNTLTALAHIKEMEERETKAIKMEHDGEETDEIFKKPKFLPSSTVKKAIKTEYEKAVLKSNKVIMPVYVVGMSHKKDKIKPKKERKNSTENLKKADLKLEHLFEDED